MRTVVIAFFYTFILSLNSRSSELEFNKLIEKGDETQRNIASDLQKKTGVNAQKKIPTSVPDKELSRGLNIKLKSTTAPTSNTADLKRKKKKRSAASTVR